MSETVEIKKDVEVDCECEVCGEDLEISCRANSFGDISCSVAICECAFFKKEEE